MTRPTASGPAASGPVVSPLSVLLVTKGLDIGGIERIVVDLANALSANGATVHVAVVNDRRNGLRSQLDATSVTVHELGGSDRIGWRAARRLAALVRSDRFDVVHVHGPLPSVLARLATRKRKVVTTSHTPLEALRRPTRWAWRLTAARDAATIAVSSSVASSMPARVAERMTVIPHGLDAAAIATARAGALPHDPSGVVAVTVASHRDAKNYPNLFRAVRIARDRGADLRLIAIGEGPALAAHQVLVRELQLEAFVGFVPPRPDVLSEIAAADLLVVASDYEGQPLVVQEALALGVPVVATSVGRVPELVTPSVGIVVPSRNVQALATALWEISTDSARRTAMGQNATKGGQAWTLDEVARAHLDVYEGIGEQRH